MAMVALHSVQHPALELFTARERESAQGAVRLSFWIDSATLKGRNFRRRWKNGREQRKANSNHRIDGPNNTRRTERKRITKKKRGAHEKNQK
jgi:hypothetical protein